ncbi:hypothetical protein SAMN05444169_5438 [Bradyrhizobium erythrophlei]|uniref:Uncharacterized protein n=1 Tax=Bradyrhizobium erythrophlei TaxID=1437360 RepID=A0A1M5PSM8_9BRAD|nr:hypothetical protein SAMN05444169_5438 [Bradyrhizobium erythrophlei]
MLSKGEMTPPCGTPFLPNSVSSEPGAAQIARLKNSWYVLLGSFLGALALGVVSNGVFYVALKYLGLPS